MNLTAISEMKASTTGSMWIQMTKAINCCQTMRSSNKWCTNQLHEDTPEVETLEDVVEDCNNTSSREVTEMLNYSAYSSRGFESQPESTVPSVLLLKRVRN